MEYKSCAPYVGERSQCASNTGSNQTHWQKSKSHNIVSNIPLSQFNNQFRDTNPFTSPFDSPRLPKFQDRQDFEDLSSNKTRNDHSTRIRGLQNSTLENCESFGIGIPLHSHIDKFDLESDHTMTDTTSSTLSQASGKAEQDYDMEHRNQFMTDVELSAVDDNHLNNTTVRNFIWNDVTVTVKDHKTKESKAILDDVSGVVEAGQYFCLELLVRMRSKLLTCL